MRTLAVFLAVIAGPWLAGCASHPPASQPLPPQSLPVLAEHAVASAHGSLFMPGAHVSLFKDHRLWHPGDLVTIDIAQNSSASTSDGSNLDHTSGVSVAVPTLFGVTPHIGKLSPDVSASSSLKSKGSGSNTASNSVQALVTAVVTRVEANGVLQLAGRTNVNVDGDIRAVEITGFARAQDIGSDNVVSSNDIANMNVQYLGDGPTQGAHHVSGFIRWLENIFPF